MTDDSAPKLVNRRENRKSTFRMGRTIGEKREKLETANERAAARRRDKKKKATRVIFTIAGFLGLLIILIVLIIVLVRPGSDVSVQQELDEDEARIYEPTVEVIDEDDPNGKITNRMKLYIGQAEADFKDLGYTPTKAVVPSGAIREVDFYLSERSGFIKTTIDRPSATSVEDADRMIRYLEGIGVEEYEYIDVRIEGKAYWK